jgi:DNA-binding transcriptional regulator YdaS (Cro superfamily)
MSRTIKSRWKSKFARFILSYTRGMRNARGQLIGGPTLLAHHLGIHPSAIYQWTKGASAPRPWHAERLHRLASKTGVRLTLEQIYQHSRQFRSGRRLEAKSEILESCKSEKRPTANVLHFPAEPKRQAVVAQLLADLGK